MKYATIDLLACPMCKYFPLMLCVIKEVKGSTMFTAKIDEPFCKTFCGFYGKYVMDVRHSIDCVECLSRDILWGVLRCPKCGEAYPIILGVPFMYPRYLRDNVRVRAVYRIFMNKIKENIECISHLQS